MSSRGRGGGRLLVSFVPMREQKNDEKGFFFRAGQCAALSSFRVGKMLFFVGKMYVFTNFTKCCRSKRVGVLIYITQERVTFLLDTVKRGINFKMSNTLFRVSFAVLCSRIGTQLTIKRPRG